MSCKIPSIKLVSKKSSVNFTIRVLLSKFVPHLWSHKTDCYFIVKVTSRHDSIKLVPRWDVWGINSFRDSRRHSWLGSPLRPFDRCHQYQELWHSKGPTKWRGGEEEKIYRMLRRSNSFHYPVITNMVTVRALTNKYNLFCVHEFMRANCYNKHIPNIP